MKFVSVCPFFVFSTLLIAPVIAQDPTLTWDASQELDGDNRWPPLQDAGRAWNLATPAIPQFGETDFPAVPVWFSAPAGDMVSLDGLGGSTGNVSWELVFRPVDLLGDHVIFETGGNGDGTAFVLRGGDLEFRVQDAAVADQRVVLTHTFSAGDEEKFHHVVATVTLGTAGTSEVQLFVNAGSPVGTLGAVGDLNDWAGGDAAGLGKINGGITIGLASVEPFTGDIALLNYYEGAVLTQAEVQTKFDDLSDGDAVEDSDMDDLPDLWEQAFFQSLDPLPGDDDEPDGLTNEEELANGTHPRVADTDQDGINDGDELSSVPPTVPTDPDTDDDGLEDGEEVTLGTSPTDRDTDGDGFDDKLELDNGFDPTDANDPPVGTGPTVVWISENTDTAGDTTPDDSGWTDLLVLYGYVVERRDIRELDTDQAALDEMNASDLVIFSRDSTSGNYDTTAEEVTAWNSGVTVPLIQMSPYLSRNARWQWFNNGELPFFQPGSNIAVSDPGHPIFSGITLDENNEFLMVEEESINLIGATDAGNGTVLATEPVTGNVWIAHWSEGVEFYEGAGQTAGADRLWFAAGAADNNPKGGENFTSDGRRAFLNAVNFLTSQEPGLEFTQYSYDPDTDRFSVTWRSVPGVNYSLDYSEDLSLTLNFDDSILATEETMSLEFDNPIEGATRLYFRVSEAP